MPYLTDLLFVIILTKLSIQFAAHLRNKGKRLNEKCELNFWVLVYTINHLFGP